MGVSVFHQNEKTCERIFNNKILGFSPKKTVHMGGLPSGKLT